MHRAFCALMAINRIFTDKGALPYLIIGFFIAPIQFLEGKVKHEAILEFVKL